MDVNPARSHSNSEEKQERHQKPTDLFEQDIGCNEEENLLRLLFRGEGSGISGTPPRRQRRRHRRRRRRRIRRPQSAEGENNDPKLATSSVETSASEREAGDVDYDTEASDSHPHRRRRRRRRTRKRAQRIRSDGEETEGSITSLDQLTPDEDTDSQGYDESGNSESRPQLRRSRRHRRARKRNPHQAGSAEADSQSAQTSEGQYHKESPKKKLEADGEAPEYHPQQRRAARKTQRNTSSGAKASNSATAFDTSNHGEKGVEPGGGHEEHHGSGGDRDDPALYNKDVEADTRSEAYGGGGNERYNFRKTAQRRQRDQKDAEPPGHLNRDSNQAEGHTRSPPQARNRESASSLKGPRYAIAVQGDDGNARAKQRLSGVASQERQKSPGLDAGQPPSKPNEARTSPRTRNKPKQNQQKYSASGTASSPKGSQHVEAAHGDDETPTVERRIPSPASQDGPRSSGMDEAKPPSRPDHTRTSPRTRSGSKRDQQTSSTGGRAGSLEGSQQVEPEQAKGEMPKAEHDVPSPVSESTPRSSESSTEQPPSRPDQARSSQRMRSGSKADQRPSPTGGAGKDGVKTRESGRGEPKQLKDENSDIPKPREQRDQQAHQERKGRQQEPERPMDQNSDMGQSTEQRDQPTQRDHQKEPEQRNSNNGFEDKVKESRRDNPSNGDAISRQKHNDNSKQTDSRTPSREETEEQTERTASPQEQLSSACQQILKEPLADCLSKKLESRQDLLAEFFSLDDSAQEDIYAKTAARSRDIIEKFVQTLGSNM